MRTKKHGLFASFLVACFALPTARAQTSRDNYLKHSVSGGFLYEVKLGQNSYFLGNAPGFSIAYSYRPWQWLALESGLEQIPRPLGSIVCCEYITNANDELYLVPFGARFVWELPQSRVRLSIGGGGAYLNHDVGQEFLGSGLQGTSRFGWQFVASGDYGVTQSGRFRVGLTARYYYVKVYSEKTARILTIGPQFTFSFR